MSLCVLGAVLSGVALVQPALAQTDATEPMPSLGALDAAGTALAAGCAASDSLACTRLADVHLRAGNGRAANALYRRAADLARAADAPRAPVRVSPVTVSSVAAAVTALEAAWASVVVPAAGSLRQLAVDARAQVFGPHAVAAWSGRRARRSDAYRTVHTMRTREGAAFVTLAWIGDLPALAAPGELWELRFGYMNLDFMAYVDDAGNVVALVHVPEG